MKHFWVTILSLMLSVCAGSSQTVCDTATYCMEYHSKTEHAKTPDEIRDYFEQERSVHWSVTFNKVALSQDTLTEALNTVLAQSRIEANYIEGFVLAEFHDESGNQYRLLLNTLKSKAIPKGVKWFCGMNDNGLVTVGIMECKDAFEVEVRNATILSSLEGNHEVRFAFKNSSQGPKAAAGWADFTEANIGNILAMEINGIFLCAPSIHTRLDNGLCAVSGLTSEQLNALLEE